MLIRSIFGKSGFLNSFTCGENLIIFFRFLESTNKREVGVSDFPAKSLELLCRVI